MTCDDDNIGSMKAIEKNGGVLENVVSGPDLEKPKRRYWIDARDSDRRQCNCSSIANIAALPNCVRFFTQSRTRR